MISLSIIYLALTSPSASIDLPSKIGRAALNVKDILGIHGLSARKVYPASSITAGAVSSYLAFSPFPQRSKLVEVVYFLRHFLYPKKEPFPLGSTMLCAARTFLPSVKRKSDRLICRYKDIDYNLTRLITLKSPDAFIFNW